MLNDSTSIYFKRNITKLEQYIGISKTQFQERFMLNIAAEQASRSKWKWAGHVARLHHTRWSQATTMWDLYTGRTSARCADYFNELVGPHWFKVARDRNE